MWLKYRETLALVFLSVSQKKVEIFLRSDPTVTSVPSLSDIASPILAGKNERGISVVGK